MKNRKDDNAIDSILCDFDWHAGGDAQALEGRLYDELAALEAVSIAQSS